MAKLLQNNGSSIQASTAHRIRLEAALLKLARLLEQNTAFLPVFERLEEELSKANTRHQRIQAGLKRARAIRDHSTMGSSTLTKCSRDAPDP